MHLNIVVPTGLFAVGNIIFKRPKTTDNRLIFSESNLNSNLVVRTKHNERIRRREHIIIFYQERFDVQR